MQRLLLLACLVCLGADTASAGLSFGGETLRDKWREMNTPGAGGGGGAALPCPNADGEGEIHFTDTTKTSNCSGDPDFTWAQTTNILTLDASGQASAGIDFAVDTVNYRIRTLDQTTASTAGAALSILTGAGNTFGAGGALTLTSGAGGNNAVGGALSLTAGAAGGGNREGGDITVLAGVGSGTQEGGDINLTGGVGGSTGGVSATGGDVTLRGGVGGGGVGTFGVGGTVNLIGGTSVDDAGGGIKITAGSASGSGSGAGGGGVVITSGSGGSAGLAARITIQGGEGTSGSAIQSPIGDVYISAGDGVGTSAGSFINIYAGDATGDGNGGLVGIYGGEPSSNTRDGGGISFYTGGTFAPAEDGGDVSFYLGDTGTTDKTGGGMSIDLGAGQGDGSPGYIYITRNSVNSSLSSLTDITMLWVEDDIISLESGVTYGSARYVKFDAPAFNGVAGGATETVTTAVTVDIEGPPTGTNVTFTNGPYGLRVGAGQNQFNPLGTAPSTCSIGGFYVDLSGAYCACSATNTWENMVATGTCA